MYKNPEKYCEFSDEIKANVEKVLNHIKVVWNSGDQKAYDYTMNWLSHSLTGHKMKTALFLKSGEGTGKSIIIDFLINHVIGKALGLSTTRSDSLMKFNYHLVNKIFLVLEELPSGGKNQWHSVSDYLKDIITGETVGIEKKYEDVIQVENMISLLILTNNENCIRFGKDARRYHMCDISHDMVGNTKYFNDLSEILNEKTGKAFFSYLTELYNGNKKFNESPVPQTNARKAMKENNITPFLKFVKDEYITYGRSIISSDNKKPYSLNLFLEEYNTYSNQKLGIQNFHNLIRGELPLIKTKQYGTNKTLHIIPIEHKTLVDYYRKKEFWDDKYDKVDKSHLVFEFQEEEEKEDYSLEELQQQMENIQAKINKK